MQIKVSVVIAAYNAEPFIRQCVESVLRQTLHEIEIICVDDGSTDQTLQILREYADKDSRFMVVPQQNKGAGNARNHGLSLAHGAYIAFLDADDFFEPDMLELSYHKCVNDNADVCVFEADLYDQATGGFHYCDWSFRRKYIPDHVPFSPKENGISKNIFRMFTGWAWDKLFNREFLIRYHLNFQEIRTTNDMRFVYTALALADKITTHEKVLAHQRLHQKGSLSNTREKSWDCFFHALKSLRETLINQGVYEIYRQAYVNWALNLALWHRNTISEEYAVRIFDLLKNYGLKELDILGYERAYYYDEWDYQQLTELITSTPSSFLLRRIQEIRDANEQKLSSYEKIIREKDELNKQLETEKNHLNKQVDEVYHSTTYRLGNTLLYLPKKIKDKVTQGEK